MKQRMLCWFSCGAPSACAAKEAIRKHGDAYEVLVVNCDTRPSEHSDNYRFSKEVEHWLGQPIIYISSQDYQTVDEVFEGTKYMAGVKGARCTTELKKIPRLKFAQPDDIHVFGFTLDEMSRVREFKARNPDMLLKWVLIESGWRKLDCLNEILRAGIKLPAMYELGYDNNNCPGCVKASSPWYWSKIRKDFPEVFERRCKQSRAIGAKLVEISHHKRIFLDELPLRDFPKGRKRENLSCGPECGIQLRLPGTFMLPILLVLLSLCVAGAQPVITSISVHDTNRVTLSFTTPVLGQIYQVQVRTLTSTNWLVEHVILGDSTNATVTVKTLGQAGLYRILQKPRPPIKL